MRYYLVIIFLGSIPILVCPVLGLGPSGLKDHRGVVAGVTVLVFKRSLMVVIGCVVIGGEFN
jgi:hypothetical protein